MWPAGRKSLLAFLVLLTLAGCTLFSVGPYALDLRYDPSATPTPLPSPTSPVPVASSTPVIPEPFVTANVSVNIRSGDSTDYPILGTLSSGDSAPLLGLSSTGSGWFYVQLPDGMPGYVSFDLVTVTGDVSALQSFDPPVLLADSYNLRIVGFSITTPDGQPLCHARTPVTLAIENASDAVALTMTVAIVQVAPDGKTFSDFYKVVPQIEARSIYEVSTDMALNAYADGSYTLRAVVDINNDIGESDESDNIAEIPFTVACE